MPGRHRAPEADTVLNVALNGETGEDSPMDVMLAFTADIASQLTPAEFAGITLRFEQSTMVIVFSGPREQMERIFTLSAAMTEVWPEWAQE